MAGGDLIAAAGVFIRAALAHLVVLPLRVAIRRAPRQWVVIGREHGKFTDNAKHFFTWLHETVPDSVQVSFVSEYPDTVAALRARGALAYRYPTFGAVMALLRAGTVVVDSADYIEHGRVALLRGTRLVQLWHGAPLKEIELSLHRRRLARLSPLKRWILGIHNAVIGRFSRVDIVVSTSKFITQRALSQCFNTERIVNTGYPRNDAMLRTSRSPLSLFNVDTSALEHLQAHRDRGGRVLLYAPTFRQDRHSPFSGGAIDLDRWADWAKRHGILLAMKLHPLMLGRYPKPPSAIVDISAESDAYPLLGCVDLLVTDYSSIFFDYLLLGRPVAFYPYDLKHYTAEDRKLYFDYDQMTPGPHFFDFDSLLDGLSLLLKNDSHWRKRREKVMQLCFDDHDDMASQRIWRSIHT